MRLNLPDLIEVLDENEVLSVFWGLSRLSSHHYLYRELLVTLKC